MANLVHSVKGRFHRELVANPLTHGWVLNLYRSGERYPQRVCDYFQSDFAPTRELAAQLRQHAADEDKHVHLFSRALGILEQPVIEADLGDVFNEVVRSFTPGTFHIRENDAPEVRRHKLANFLAHAHHLEKRVAQSFAYHMDACERSGKGSIASLVSRTKADEDRHVQYTRTTVFDLLTHREAQSVMELHRRAEARANLHFSRRQVLVFLALFGDATPKHRQWLYRICATIMEAAGNMFETEPAPAQRPGLRLEALRQRLATLEESAAVELFQPGHFNRLLKTTISLCPECLAHVPALVFTRGGHVLMRKICDHHGPSEALLENDEGFYHLSNKDRWGRRFAEDKVMDFPALAGGCCCGGNGHEADEGDFADQTTNKSCTILAEVTNACNLACPVCYSDARGDRKMPLARFKEYMLRLIKLKGGLDSVQLTGGEAVLHPEFWEMVEFLHVQPVKKIYLPTNGIVFADAALAARCAPFRDKLMVLLQFDGQQSDTNRAMRDANTCRVRDLVIENFGRLGIHMQLTMTITQGVNDHEIGWVVETGLRHAHIKVVALQPVTYSGRYQLAQDPLRRLTLSDCVKAVVAQVHRPTNTNDFKPIPCSHPNCGWITLFVQRFGVTANISRHIDLGRAMGRVANRTMLNSDELRSVVGTNREGLLKSVGLWAGRKLIRSTDVFAVAIKPFMDRFNYDQDRISACCHHLLDTKGNPVSFCEYNARLRMGDSWSSFPPLKSSVGGTT